MNPRSGGEFMAWTVLVLLAVLAGILMFHR